MHTSITLMIKQSNCKQQIFEPTKLLYDSCIILVSNIGNWFYLTGKWMKFVTILVFNID